jgi:hypothetical protein
VAARLRFIAALIVGLSLALILGCGGDSEQSGCTSGPPKLRVDGQRLADPSGRTVVLRGFVTLADDEPTYDYDTDAYRRIARLGSNVQVIRVGEDILSGQQGVAALDGYLWRVRRMVANASCAGLYTVLKMTIYDDPSYTGSDREATWGALWDGSGPERDRLEAAWRRLGGAFRDDPSVIGYDLINEPEQGSYSTMTGSDFDETYLTPEYQRLIDLLHDLDSGKVAFFQGTLNSYFRSLFDPASVTGQPYGGEIGRPNAVYAAHFYPNFANWVERGDASTAGYRSLFDRFQASADANGVPLYLGEFDMPFNPDWDGDRAREAGYTRLAEATAELVDQSGISATRAWYSDDRAEAHRGGEVLDWAIIMGQSGLSGPERHVVTDVFARPHPVAVAGGSPRSRFDFDARSFDLEWVSDGSGRTSTIFVPLGDYPGGFAVTSDGSPVLEVDAAGIGHSSPGSGDSWSAATQLLSVSGSASGRRTLRIMPRS